MKQTIQIEGLQIKHGVSQKAEEDFQHFLAYTGYSSRCKDVISIMREAYYAAWEEKNTNQLAITVWRDGTYQVWGGMDAYYAQSDEDFLTNIGVGDLEKIIANEMRRNLTGGGD